MNIYKCSLQFKKVLLCKMQRDFAYLLHIMNNWNLFLQLQAPPPPSTTWPPSVWTPWRPTIRAPNGSCHGAPTSAARSKTLMKPRPRESRPITLCLRSTFLCPTERWVPGSSSCWLSSSLTSHSKGKTRLVSDENVWLYVFEQVIFCSSTLQKHDITIWFLSLWEHRYFAESVGGDKWTPRGFSHSIHPKVDWISHMLWED